MNGHFPLGDISPFRYFFGIALTVGLVFAFISANTDTPFLLHLIQWQMQSILPMGLMVSAHLILSKIRFFHQLSPWKRVSTSGVLGASFFAPLALFIDIFYIGEGWPAQFFIALFDEWSAIIFPVVLVWLLINAPWLLGVQFIKQTAPVQSSLNHEVNGERELNCAFMSYLRQDMGNNLLCISSQLHYLDVITDKGHQLILYALKDAILEIPENKGMQVHRSYWVAYEAVESLKKTGRQGMITLNNGMQVPVSRTYLKTLSDKLKGHDSALMS